MNIEFFNLVKPLEESDKGRKEKNRGNELIWVIIHIYMEMSQGNSLYSYINKEKCYFSFFFIYKYERTGGQNRSCLGGWYQWEGEGCRERVCEGEYVANTVYTCM
jgi:hypothetical protein